ncbi:MAG: GNAT family N-acetyltransferase [Hyphomicrobiaceae bacterium]
MSQVTDNRQQGRFEMLVEGHTAFVTYRISGDTAVLNHAEVPAELEGRGVGSRLVRGTLEHLRERGMQVVPRCSFVAAFIRKNAEFADMLANGR